MLERSFTISPPPPISFTFSHPPPPITPQSHLATDVTLYSSLSSYQWLHRTMESMSSSKVTLKHLDRPLVPGCSTGHTSCPSMLHQDSTRAKPNPPNSTYQITFSVTLSGRFNHMDVDLGESWALLYHLITDAQTPKTKVVRAYFCTAGGSKGMSAIFIYLR